MFIHSPCNTANPNSTFSPKLPLPATERFSQFNSKFRVTPLQFSPFNILLRFLSHILCVFFIRLQFKFRGCSKNLREMEECGRLKWLGDGVGWVRGSVIGKGGFGCVYLATPRNPKSRNGCLPPAMAVKSAEVSISGSIQKEREILSNLKGCPNVIRCFGEETTMGENGLMVYNLLLEYGSGGTLSDRIKKFSGKGLPELEVRVFTRSILRGLVRIHDNGYVHCDLKPENVLLVEANKQFVAKIGDFGLAKRAHESKKRRLEPYWRGTPMYLSPEAVVDRLQEAPCDVWALGCVVLEMLTGKPVWEEAKPEEILRRIGERNELPKIPSGISKDARDFLKGCFVRQPMFRLTAEMLLRHPFVKGLDDNDDDRVEESWEVEDLYGIESIPMALVFDIDSEDYEYGSDLLDIGLEEDSFSCWSEECSQDVVIGVANSVGEDEECAGELLLHTQSERGRQYPLSFTIPATI